MTDDGIGRILVASLHQGIGDTLPMRLEYYEHWLTPMGLKDGRTGRAPLGAVLSFLRQEGREVYDRVMTRAGRYSAQWHFEQAGGAQRLGRLLPYRLRARLALRRSRALVRSAFTPARVTAGVRRGVGSVTVSGGIFCTVREPLPWPACRYVAAAVEAHLALQGVRAAVQITSCQATGDPACTMQVTFLGQGQEPLTDGATGEEAA